MNKDCKPFENNKFLYPVASGIFSAREFNFYNTAKNRYAVSSYYKDGKEGVMCVGKDVDLILSESGYALFPVSLKLNNETIMFWSEYNGQWYIKCTLKEKVPEIDGDLFVYSACIDNSGRIYLACELMNGYMNSDVLVLQYYNKKWKTHKKLNSENTFCKRPQIAAWDNYIFLVWDGYSSNGYDIYMNSLKNGNWTGEKRITDSSDWYIKPSITIDNHGSLWIAWLKNTDVIRDGVISKINTVEMTYISSDDFKPIPDSRIMDVTELNIGLLPRDRYFGYHGLRRNPQITCFRNGDIGLFWEMQRDETEVWENVENGYFVCMFYDGSVWSQPYLIQDGGNCFTIDSSVIIDDTIHYAYRGYRETGSDIKFGSINVIDLLEIKLPYNTDWDDWMPVKFKGDLNKQQSLYWGDLHCHSIYSPDAEGYPDELLFYARDRSAIDFCAITDNDIYGDNILTKSALRYTQSLCDCLSKDNVFQAYTGYEWTYHKPEIDEPDNFNHRTIIFLDDKHIIASRADTTGANEAAFLETLRDTDTMWHAHHGIWQILDPGHDINAEVVSAWSNNMKEFDTVHKQLAEGQVFGFMGASDNHRFIPGHGGALTGVCTDVLSKRTLKEAFLKRHNFATCGSKTIVTFSINGYSMGDIVSDYTSEDLLLSLQVESERMIESLTIIHNGDVYKKIEIAENSCKMEFSMQPEVENAYFYLEIKLVGEDLEFPHNLAAAKGNYIYTSPIWVKF